MLQPAAKPSAAAAVVPVKMASPKSASCLLFFLFQTVIPGFCQHHGKDPYEGLLVTPFVFNS